MNMLFDASPGRADFQLANPSHEAFRQELVRKYGTSNYMCGVFSRAMATQFPDLSAMAGFYYSPSTPEQPEGASHGEHWWLVDSDGCIVDPTADQFPSQGQGRYVRYDPALHAVIKGKCPGCGTGLYTRQGTYPCSPDCAQVVAEEYGCRIADGPFEVDMAFDTDADITERYGIVFDALSP